MTAGRIFIFLCIAILVAVVGINLTNSKPKEPVVQAPIGGEKDLDQKNTTYEIEGSEVTLKNGISEIAIANSSATTTTRYFGNETRGDLNGDGKEDVAFILTRNLGGSGTFYYLAVALKVETGYQGTNTLLLGDRVAPMPTEIKNGIAIANFAIRKDGESMVTPPSVATSTYAKIVGGKLTLTTQP